MRRTTRLLVVLIVLAIVAILIERNRTRTFSPKEVLLLRNVPLEQVNSISIVQDKDTVELKKEDGEWKVIVNGVPKRCDEGKVDRLFSTLDSLRGEPVSSNPSRYSDFEVGAKGRRITLISDGDTLVTLIVGKTGPSFSSSYVRIIGDRAVYLVNKYLRGTFPTEVERWRDRKIVDLEKDRIVRIRVEGKKKLAEIEKEDTVFIVKEGACDTTKINSFLFTWCKLRAVGFADTVDLKEAGLTKPKYTVVLVSEGGPEVKLFVGKEKEKGRYYLKREDDEQIYLIASYAVNRIKDLLKEKKS